MKKAKIYFKNIYYCSHQKFNVSPDKKGQPKIHKDPVFQKSYIYGSANNVKHCMRCTYTDIIGDENADYETIFQKFVEIKNGKARLTQGGVSVNPDFKLNKTIIFGAMLSGCTNAKYLKMALKACMNIGEFKPLHTLLASKYSGGGVNTGTSKVKTVYVKKEGDKTYDKSTECDNLLDFFKANPEFDKYPKDELNNNELNIFEEETANGIYAYEMMVDMCKFGKICTTKIEFTKEGKQDIGKLLQNDGWTKQVINNETYLVPPLEDIKSMWEAFAQTQFEWEFQSNNSTHGSVNQYLRTCISLNEPQLWLQSTRAKIAPDNNSAYIVINDNYEEVKTFNSPLLEQYMTVDGDKVKYDDYAHKNAYKELLELGDKCIDEAYPKSMTE